MTILDQKIFRLEVGNLANGGFIRYVKLPWGGAIAATNEPDGWRILELLDRNSQPIEVVHTHPKTPGCREIFLSGQLVESHPEPEARPYRRGRRVVMFPGSRPAQGKVSNLGIS